jgi:hypothetical protein
MKTIEEIVTFCPQISDAKYGTEPSLEEMMYFFYREHDLSPEKAKQVIKQYIEALKEFAQ